MLTEEQVESFYRDGYIIARGLVDTDAVNRIIAAGRDKYGSQAGGAGWTAAIFEHQNPEKDAHVHELLRYPAIVNAVHQIFEQEPRVYYGMLAVVPANGGKGLPWHQDNQYDQVQGRALNCFIALSQITPEKANLWVAPKTHLLGTQPSKASDDYGAGHKQAAVEPANGMPLPTLEPGDVVIFDRNTYHRSLRNETDSDRYAYAAQYQADDARDVNGKKDPLKMRVSDLIARLAA